MEGHNKQDNDTKQSRKVPNMHKDNRSRIMSIAVVGDTVKEKQVK